MSYREAILRAEEKSRTIVATWPGFQRDLLEVWMARYDPTPATQSILDFTPGENRLARLLHLSREAAFGTRKSIVTLQIAFPRRY
jgi:hypothetical protein